MRARDDLDALGRPSVDPGRDVEGDATAARELRRLVVGGHPDDEGRVPYGVGPDHVPRTPSGEVAEPALLVLAQLRPALLGAQGAELRRGWARGVGGSVRLEGGHASILVGGTRARQGPRRPQVGT
ncbi:hypothetical protein GCM10022197_00730 [Microlunatus spumicola]|uniref:Uncharacterized protein n=1 Tax=Microlunatus spumicola TaxID=81499 RepID=A0ABP6WDC0_9ACTN